MASNVLTDEQVFAGTGAAGVEMSDEQVFGLPMRKDSTSPGFFTSLRQSFTGEGRKEDLPEFLSILRAPVPALPGQATPEMQAQGAMVDRIKNAVMSTSDDRARVDIITKSIPGTKPGQDQYGNPIIEYGGQRYYVNRPGLSQQDLLDTTSEITRYLPAGGIAGFGKNLATRMLYGGAAAGATSVAEDALGWLQGSDQPLDKAKAAGAAIGGAGGELIGAGLGRLLRATKPRLVQDDSSLTQEGRKVVQKAGIDPAQITPDVARRLNQMLQQADASALSDPTIVTEGINRAATDRFGIPLTKGQATGDAMQIANEEAMRNGARGGNAAYETMRAFDERQAQAVRDATTTLGTTLGGGRTMPGSVQDVGALVTQAVRQAEDKADDAVRQAYRGVDMRSVKFDATAVGDFARSTARNLRANRIIDPDLTPGSARILKEMNRLAKVTDLLAKNRANPTVTLKQTEAFRRRVNAFWNKARSGTQANRADAEALNEIKRQLDGFLDDAVDNALLSGDPTQLDALKEARKLRAQYGEKFEIRPNDPDAGRLVERILSTDVNNQEVANWLYGAGDLGSSQSSKRLLARMSKIVGKDTPEWQAIKQGAWARMLWGAKGAKLDDLPRKTIINRIDDALVGRGSEISRELFSKEEIQAIWDFRKALALTRTPDQLTNPSKTAYALERMGRMMLGNIAGLATSATPAGPVGGMIVQGAANLLGAEAGGRAARKAVEGFVLRPPPRPIVTGLAAGAGASLGTSQ